MKNADLAVILVTASSRAEAEKISAVLLGERKAACVNIIPGVSSRFWWQGKIDSADELLLVIKTRISAIQDIIALVKKNHSYAVPEIIALPVIDGSADYLSWIREETRE